MMSRLGPWMFRSTPMMWTLKSLSSVPSNTVRPTATIPGFTYVSPDGTSGYDISFTADGSGNPVALNNADAKTKDTPLFGKMADFYVERNKELEATRRWLNQ